MLSSQTPLIFAVALPAGTGPNRAPGDVKPSWKWSTALATHPLLGIRNEYRQALSQVNWYMRQHNSRHGFLLTNRELVVFRRVDDSGNLELVPPIPFTSGGSMRSFGTNASFADQGSMSGLLKMRCIAHPICMLVACTGPHKLPSGIPPM
ncbi:hypothetical protein ACO22_05766 [Paracoccidioides brasiliensis]|uniref:Uncharacterized protein n=1 Tax=Paracoccidioides brasiliensis TaxID=121759 RepID=A0A1D2J9I0_PARBR|nr:hypothetical protein ACO22_05766 [Paracoccidioides brasiliensis]